MTEMKPYVPPRVWTWDKTNGGAFASTNRPVAGPTHDRALPLGQHPFQLYSLATPNGVKVTILRKSCWQRVMPGPNMTPG